MLQGGDRAGTQGSTIDNDGVAFDASIQIQMRSVAGVEYRIVLKNYDRGLDGVQRRAAGFQDSPACGQGAFAT